MIPTTKIVHITPEPTLVGVKMMELAAAMLRPLGNVAGRYIGIKGPGMQWWTQTNAHFPAWPGQSHQ